MRTNANNYIIRGIKAACLAACVLTPVSVFADTPNTLNIQGQVDDVIQGSGLNGRFDVRFTLYDTEIRNTNYITDGGTYLDTSADPKSVIWTSVINVTFANGIYSAELGASIPFPVDSFISDSEVLGIQIGDDEELAPRLTFNATPYALRSNVSSNVDGDITPRSISIADESESGVLVIDEYGKWVGDTTGLKGERGFQGADGKAGDKGETGAAGKAGDKGEIGTAGSDGKAGDKGETGAAGTDGKAGDKGETGAAGKAGDKGDIGTAGTDGKAGDKGETGAAGKAGDKGEIGTAGTDGKAGDKGEKGETGAAGADGNGAGGSGFGSNSLVRADCRGEGNCSCPEGKIIVSGGAICSKGETLNVSFPSNMDFKTWIAYCSKEDEYKLPPALILLVCITDNDYSNAQ
jgi:hypothetical protein